MNSGIPSISPFRQITGEIEYIIDPLMKIVFDKYKYIAAAINPIVITFSERSLDDGRQPLEREEKSWSDRPETRGIPL